ncbi:transporter substrate-binding domain-containing protein [Alteromonas aestuariivivens]|nr:transporter substrate-binding domain-containing protein [Alteromonas aestuariivivens]
MLGDKVPYKADTDSLGVVSTMCLPRLCTFLVLLFTVGQPLLCRANQSTAYRIAVEDIDYYPIQNFSGFKAEGFLPELLELFVEDSGLMFEFIPLPLNRVARWYQDGLVDFKIPDNEKWSELVSPGTYFSQPILTFCEETIVLKQNAKIRAPEVKRLGTLVGFTPSPRWKKQIAQGELKLVRDSSLKVLTRMLLNGMVDGLDLSIDAVRHQLNSLGQDEDKVVVAPNISAGHLAYRMSSVNHPEVIALFNDFLLRHHDSIRRLADSYRLEQLPGCPPIFLRTEFETGNKTGSP